MASAQMVVPERSGSKDFARTVSKGSEGIMSIPERSSSKEFARSISRSSEGQGRAMSKGSVVRASLISDPRSSISSSLGVPGSPGSPGSPGAVGRVSVLGASPRGHGKAMLAMESRKTTVTTKHLSRPADVGWSKTKSALAELGLAGELDGSFAGSKMNYSSIAEKEERLETIMSAEAQLSFDCLSRHQMESSMSSRLAVDTMQMKGTAHMHQLVKVLEKMATYEKDLQLDTALEDDPSFVDKFGLQQWQAQPGDMALLPPALSAKLGCSLGAALPVSKKTKSSIASALGSLLGAKGGKVSSALGNAVDLGPERCFAARCGDLCLTGVVTAHGNRKLAGSLALLLAQELPRYLFRSASLVRKRNVAQGFTDAFHRAHLKAISQLDMSMTGAAITALLISKEFIWTAHVGDNRCVLAVPDETGNVRDFHFASRPLTEDHKLCVKKEFDRIKAAGGEVRKLMNDQISRLFLPETHFPSLALTRSVGDRLGHMAGVIHKPTVSVLKRKDLPKGSFLLLAAPGVWANFSETAAVNWASRNFSDTQAAVMSLAAEALERWDSPDCKTKGNLHEDTKEAFSSIMLRLQDEEDQQPPQSARKFVLGPVKEMPGTPQKAWEEVKSSDRTLQLRQMLPELERIT